VQFVHLISFFSGLHPFFGSQEETAPCCGPLRGTLQEAIPRTVTQEGTSLMPGTAKKRCMEKQVEYHQLAYQGLFVPRLQPDSSDLLVNQQVLLCSQDGWTESLPLLPPRSAIQ